MIESDRPVIVLPADGAGRPDTVALLALWLADEGQRVVVHGDAAAAPAGTRAVLADLGIGVAPTARDVAAAWQRRQPAFVERQRLAPPSHPPSNVPGPRCEAAPLTAPIRGARSLCVVSAPHRSAAARWAESARRGGLDLMIVGTQASACTAPLHRQPRIDTWIAGVWRVELALVERALSPLETPSLPAIADATANALWVQSVLSGERPLPVPLERQVERIVAAVHLLEAQPAPAGRGPVHRAGASSGARAAEHLARSRVRD